MRFRLHIVTCIAICCALLSATDIASAAKVFRWTDRNGVVHYGDYVPDHVDPTATTVTRIPVPAEPSTIVKLRLEPIDIGHEAWAENTIAGPIEVLLYQRGADDNDDSPLRPVRAVLPALARTFITTLYGDQTHGVRMAAVPGDPAAQPRDVEYAYPLQTDQLRIEQGYGGRYSHTDAQNRQAVDFAAPIGTPVLAARAGVVMDVAGDFEKAGLNAEKYAGRANFVRILHDDGTMALYAHLKLDGVLVRQGQRVRKGQTIGLSGNTGYTTGPHLHFVVQVNRGMSLESIPFRMFGPQGILRFTEPKHSVLNEVR